MATGEAVNRDESRAERWVEYRENCEFPDVRDIRDAIKAGEHVGAAAEVNYAT